MAYNAPSTRTTGDLINATIWNADIVANIIAVYAGGLSVTSQAVGDILYASSTTQLGRVGIGSANKVLTSSGSAPQWSSNIDIPGTLDVTGATTLDSTLTSAGKITAGDLLDVTGGASEITPLTLSRPTSTAGHGVGLSYLMGDSASATADHEYCTMYPYIAVNTNGSQDANFVLNLSRAGSLAEIFRIHGASGNMSIGTTTDLGTGCLLNVAKDTDNKCYFGKAFMSSIGSGMTADRAHWGHVDHEVGTRYAIMQHSNGDTNLNAPTGQSIYFNINAATKGSFSADGLLFGSDSAAANALDDYEEGTWTVQPRGSTGSEGLAAHNMTGHYTKIGRQVTVTCYGLITNKGSWTGNAEIHGLPFQAVSQGSNGCLGYYPVSEVDAAMRTVDIPQPTTTMRFHKGTALDVFEAYSDWNTGQYLTITATYWALT